MPLLAGGVVLSLKKELKYSFALGIAEEFLEKTRDLYRRAEIAGSLRRKEHVIHDIDFAVIPSLDDFTSWTSKLRERIAQIGGSTITLGDTICDLQFKSVQVNLFICSSEDTWGVVLLWATGPKGHTIGLTIKARAKGLTYNFKGIWTRGEKPILIATPTELDAARILGWKYKPPEQRGKSAKGLF
ncbi:MAG: nucleotidyltransferase family protein [Nitrososphaerales archaeon]